MARSDTSIGLSVRHGRLFVAGWAGGPRPRKVGVLNLGPRSESVEGTPVYAMRRKGGVTPGGCVSWRAEPGLARRADDAFLCDAVAYRKGIPCCHGGAHWARTLGILRCRCARPGLPSCLASPCHSYRGSPPRKRSFWWWAISFISRVLCCLALALAQYLAHRSVDSLQLGPHDLRRND